MPHPGGRPISYKPTDAERVMVKNMAAAGLSQQTIQLCLPNAPKHPKTFVKNFKAELSTSGPLVTAHAVSKLVVAIGNGEAWAICFWLKCRAGFQETAAHRFVGGDGKDRTLDLASVQAYCASIPDDPA